MSKNSTAKIIKKTRYLLTKHSPEILTGIGIAGMVTSTILAVKATPKALDIIEDNTGYYEDDFKRPEGFEIVKLCWKCYIPSILTGALSVSCLIGASSVNLKRNAVIATAYKLSETALSEYRDAVMDTIGEKKEQLVRDKVAEEKLKKDPVSKKEVIITERGNTLCYDAISGRYFRSDMEAIKRAQNAINKEMLSQNYVALNDFYEELNLNPTSLGDNLGWSIDNGMVDINFSSRIAEDGNPCLVIDYSIAPAYDYWKFT